MKNNKVNKKKDNKLYTSNFKNKNKSNKEIEKKNNSFDDQVEGRNSVLELLESGKDINKIFVAKGERQGSINKIIGKAKDSKVVIVETDKRKLDEMSQTGNHQGVIAIIPPFEYCECVDKCPYELDIPELMRENYEDYQNILNKKTKV